MSPKRLGMTVRVLRIRKKLTQAQLAAKVPCHRIYLAQIEAGIIATLEKIAKALNVKVARLLE